MGVFYHIETEFNKTLINDYNLSNPYNLVVKSGDYEMAKKRSQTSTTVYPHLRAGRRGGTDRGRY